jgi:3-oxoacyl-[acyl-carrier protein] reductase
VRHVVVTGGGTGIGFAVAGSFARAGDAVTITGRRREVLTTAADRLGARAVAFDASDPEAVRAALGELPDRVDVLVNNAGGNTDFDRPEPPDGDLVALAAGWRANLDANLMSAVLVTAALTPRLADGARIVTVGSIAARQGAGSLLPRQRWRHGRWTWPPSSGHAASPPTSSPPGWSSTPSSSATG